MESPTTNRPKSGGRLSPLSASEWFLAAIFLLLIVSFIVIAKVNVYRADSVLSKLPTVEEETLSVTIEGAVKKPGTYRMQRGASVEELLRKAKPTFDANLRHLPLTDRIDHSLHIHVEKLNEIRVNVKGAVGEEIELLLPMGSRICDLKSKITFTEETDRRFFRRKRRLKDGETIEIPRKRAE